MSIRRTINQCLLSPAIMAVATSISTLWVLTTLIYASEVIHVGTVTIIAFLVGFFTYNLIKTQQLQSKLEYNHATKDPLTKIYNKRYLDDIGKREIRACLRSQYDLSVVMFKIDDYDSIIAKYGKKYADKALVTLTENIQQKTREGDVFARLKDNEFVILCPQADQKTTHELARRIQLLTKSLVVTYTQKETIEFTCSVAITQYSPETDREFNDLVSRAEHELETDDELSIA